MSKPKNNRQQKQRKKHQMILLAEMTHQLTGEQESDIKGYLEKFVIEAFFTKLDSTKTQPYIRNKICELYKTFEEN